MFTAKQVFDRVAAIGERLDKHVHILFSVNDAEWWQEFRIYFGGGYCVNVRRERSDDKNEADEEGFVYIFRGDFEGFGRMDEEKMMLVLDRHGL